MHARDLNPDWWGHAGSAFMIPGADGRMRPLTKRERMRLRALGNGDITDQEIQDAARFVLNTPMEGAA